MKKSRLTKANSHPWNIGDEFIAPNWDGLTVFKVDKVGHDYIQSNQPGSRVKLRFNKSNIIPVNTHEHTTR